MTQQAVTGLVPERMRLAGDHSHRGRSGPRPPRGAVPGGPGRCRSPSAPARPPASPPSPAAPPARACDANPLAGFGSEASKDQHYVLDASHTTKGMTAQ